MFTFSMIKQQTHAKCFSFSFNLFLNKALKNQPHVDKTLHLQSLLETLQIQFCCFDLVTSPIFLFCLHGLDSSLISWASLSVKEPVCNISSRINPLDRLLSLTNIFIFSCNTSPWMHSSTDDPKNILNQIFYFSQEKVHWIGSVCFKIKCSLLQNSVITSLFNHDYC